MPWHPGREPLHYRYHLGVRELIYQWTTYEKNLTKFTAYLCFRSDQNIGRSVSNDKRKPQTTYVYILYYAYTVLSKYGGFIKSLRVPTICKLRGRGCDFGQLRGPPPRDIKRE